MLKKDILLEKLRFWQTPLSYLFNITNRGFCQVENLFFDGNESRVNFLPHQQRLGEI
jgi:hypothetical protein